MSDYLAAKENDQLEHSSILGDIVSGLVKGAIYTAIGVAAVALTIGSGGLLTAAGGAIMLGAGAATAFTIGDVIDSIADWVGDLCGTSLDATIITGSENTHTKSLKSARAAGSIHNDVLIADILAEKMNPPDPKATSMAKKALDRSLMLAIPSYGALELAKTVRGMFINQAEPIYYDANGDVIEKPAAQPSRGFLASLVSPTVAGAHPYASQKNLDKIACTKWHPFSPAEQFLAEGSKKVLINSQPACRNGDRSTCEAKIKHQHDAPHVRIGGNSVVVRDIASGKNPIAHFVGEVAGSFGVNLLAGGLRRLALRQLPCLLGSFAAELGTSAVFSLGMGGLSHVGSSLFPVRLSSGTKVLSDEADQDFVVPGIQPLVWQRVYCSRNNREGILGKGWSLPFEMSLSIQESADEEDAWDIIFTDVTGRELNLGVVDLDTHVFYVNEGITLYRTAQNTYFIETEEGDFLLFEADPLRPNSLRLYQTVNRHDQALRYQYDLEGRIFEILDENKGVHVRLNYDKKYKSRVQSVVQLTEKNQKLLIQYEYNDKAELITVLTADQQINRRFQYNDHGLMSMHGFSTGLSSHYTWQRLEEFQVDGSSALEWYVKEQWLTDGERTLEKMTLEYDLVNRTLMMHEDGIGTSFRAWNIKKCITEYRSVSNEQWSFNWDEEADLIKALTDPKGEVYSFGYDERGNLFSEVNPLGDTRLTEWHHRFALPIRITESNGAQWEYGYNDKGDLIRVTDPLKQSTRYVYNELGLLVLAQDALGKESHLRYNEYGQVTHIRDCSNYETKYGYDDFGTLTTHVDATGATTRYYYTTDGKISEIENAFGKRQRIKYNEKGLPINVTDIMGRATQFSYNARGQLLQRTNKDGTQFSYGYDRLGRLLRITNEQDESYRFLYDENHRLVEQTDLLGIKKHYQYDTLGQLITVTETSSALHERALEAIITTFERDAIGRIVAKTQSGSDVRTEYDYGKNDLKVKRFTTHDHTLLDTVSFAYDLLGQLTSEENHGGIYQYRYDANGNLLETQLPDQRYLRHLYYGSGHLLQTNLEIGGTYEQGDPTERFILAEYERDALHREIHRSQGVLTLDTEYDPLGRVLRKTSRLGGRFTLNAPRFDQRFRYNDANQLIEKMVQEPNAQNKEQRDVKIFDQMDYDAKGQVVRLTQDAIRQHNFSYDDSGNLQDQSLPKNALKGNQISHYNGYQYSYDAFGRLKTRVNKRERLDQRFEYNSDHQLVEVHYLNHPLYRSVEFKYDALGRRTHKVVNHHISPQAPKEVVITTFFWDGMHMVGEKSNTSQTQDVLYVYNQHSYEPMVRVDRHYEVHSIYYYHTQFSGLPDELTDEQGQTIWKGDYSLWGKLRHDHRPYDSDAPYLFVEQNLGFQGQYYDRETGLNYNTFRYYDPEIGRFTQQDPIGLAGGFNLYQYAPNTLTWIDPWGWSCWTPKNVQGRKVYQRDNIFFDPNSPVKNLDIDMTALNSPSFNKLKGLIDDGFTNKQLMELGYAPFGIDGKQINLHHVIGKEPGPMVEILGSQHKQHHRALHGLIEKGNSFRNNSSLSRAYDKFRGNYWKERAKDF